MSHPQHSVGVAVTASCISGDRLNLVYE